MLLLYCEQQLLANFYILPSKIPITLFNQQNPSAAYMSPVITYSSYTDWELVVWFLIGLGKKVLQCLPHDFVANPIYHFQNAIFRKRYLSLSHRQPHESSEISCSNRLSSSTFLSDSRLESNTSNRGTHVSVT